MLVAVPHRHELLLLPLLHAAAAAPSLPAAAAVDLARTIPLPAVLLTKPGPTHPDTSASGVVLEMLKASRAAVPEQRDAGIVSSLPK